MAIHRAFVLGVSMLCGLLTMTGAYGKSVFMRSECNLKF